MMHGGKIHVRQNLTELAVKRDRNRWGQITHDSAISKQPVRELASHELLELCYLGLLFDMFYDIILRQNLIISTSFS